MDKIVFFADSHTYWLGDKQLSSVGKYLKRYFPPYNEPYWLAHKALKEILGDVYMEHYRSFKRMMPPEEELFPPMLNLVDAEEYFDQIEAFKGMWARKRNESAYWGTRFHDAREAEHYENGEAVNPFTGETFKVIGWEKQYDNESFGLDLSVLEDGMYPELVVFDLLLGVAGQADEIYIETIDGIRYFDINDHKTNEKKPGKSSLQYCLPPFDTIQASKHNSYSFQINLYAGLLARHGFTPRHLAYTHYKKYDKTTANLILVEDYSPEIEIMFQKP